MDNQEEKLNFAMLTYSGLALNDIIDGDDKVQSGLKWVKWGGNNKFPNYLWDSYLKCSNLQAICNTITDYVCGDEIITNEVAVKSNDGCSLDDTIRRCALDFIIFGGFAVECIRNVQGDIVMINYQNVMNIRVNQELTTAYISNKWNTYSNSKVIELPLYNPLEKQDHFILYYRGRITRGYNPVPMYISALKSVEILNNTRNFHMRNLQNGFTASTLINLNNGDISTRELREIKEKLEIGFTGSENAGKFMLINGGDKDHAATIEKLNADNFGEQYKSLSESSIDDLYVAFRINPILLGKNGNTGFTQQEFAQAYKLYYRTTIKPLQQQIVNVFESIGINVEISEFKINWEE